MNYAVFVILLMRPLLFQKLLPSSSVVYVCTYVCNNSEKAEISPCFVFAPLAIEREHSCALIIKRRKIFFIFLPDDVMGPASPNNRKGKKESEFTSKMERKGESMQASDRITTIV